MRCLLFIALFGVTLSSLAQTKVLRHAPQLPTSVRINFDDPDAFKRSTKEAKKEANKDQKEEKKRLKVLNKLLGKKLDSLQDLRAKENRKKNLRDGLKRLDKKGVMSFKGADKYKKYKKDSNRVKSFLKDYAKENSGSRVNQVIDNEGVDSSMVAGEVNQYASGKLGSKYNDISAFTIYKDSVRVIFENDSVRKEFVKALASDNQYYQQGDSIMGGGSGFDHFLAFRALSSDQYGELSGSQMSKEDLIPSMEEHFAQFGIRPEELDFEDKDAAKNKGRNFVEGQYKNHFAGKEDKLLKGKANLEALKKKRTFKDFLQYFFDQEKDAMKEMPLKERFSFGGYMEFQRGNPNVLDISPLVGYKLTGKFTTGVGMTYRQGIGGKGTYINQPPEDVLGYRLYGDYKFLLGLYFHGEFESLRVKIPSQVADDQFTQDWANGVLFGLGRDFRIRKDIYGSAQLLYNFSYEKGHTPYQSPWQFRFGFKYQ